MGPTNSERAEGYAQRFAPRGRIAQAAIAWNEQGPKAYAVKGRFEGLGSAIGEEHASSTGARPRKRAVTPVSDSRQDGVGCPGVKPAVPASVTEDGAGLPGLTLEQTLFGVLVHRVGEDAGLVPAAGGLLAVIALDGEHAVLHGPAPSGKILAPRAAPALGGLSVPQPFPAVGQRGLGSGGGHRARRSHVFAAGAGFFIATAIIYLVLTTVMTQISDAIERLTTSRLARSLALGA